MAQAISAQRRIARWVLLGGALALSAVAQARDRPLLWALHGPANTVYIAGSMHMLKPEDATLADGLDQAYARAKRVVMEIDMDDLDQSAAAQWMMQHGSYSPESHKTLRAALGEERWKRIDAITQKSGLPLEAMNAIEPWVVGLTFSVLQMQSLGLDTSLGVEEQLTARAKQDHKPITGLETIEQQLTLFDSLSDADQVRFLDLTVDETQNPKQQLEEMTAAWRRGDEAELSRELLQEYGKFPGLYDTLVKQRNLAWIPQIKALLTGKEDCLVVVGALHLVGERGVISLLQKDGLKPQRIQH